MLNRLPIDKALRQLIETGTGKPCGWAVFPTTSGGAVEAPPFSVLYPIDGAYSGPPLDDWSADAAWTYQVTVVATRADQLAWLGDKVRATILGRSAAHWTSELTAPGLTVQDRQHAGTGPVVAEGQLVSYAELFTLSVTEQ